MTSAMNSKMLHFLFVLVCGTLIALGPLSAQNQAARSDTATTADHARTADTAANNADSQRAANAAIANDRDAVHSDASTTHMHTGWIGLLGLLGLLGLFRKDGRQVRRVNPEDRGRDYRRAA